MSVKVKEQAKIKRDTFNFCLQDNTNYEDTLSKFKDEGLSSYNTKVIPGDSKEIEKELLMILLTFDKISIGVQNMVFDEEIIKSYYGKYFIEFHENFKMFIMVRRKETKNPYLFIEYEKTLYNWLNEIHERGGI